MLEVTYDWGNNIVTIQGEGQQVTIPINQAVGKNNSRPEVLICYDLGEGVT